MSEAGPLVFKALQTYKSKEKTELGFKKGQLITVEKRNSQEDLLYGFYGKKEGWFPSYYAVQLEGAIPETRKLKHASSRAKLEVKKEEDSGSSPLTDSNGTGNHKHLKSRKENKESKESKKKADQEKKEAELKAKKEAKEALMRKKHEMRQARKTQKENEKQKKLRGKDGSKGGKAKTCQLGEENRTQSLPEICMTSTGGLPAIIEDTISYLEHEDRLKLEGLFRVSGSLTDVRSLSAAFLRGTPPDLSNVQDPHTVAGVLKIFFREARDPLLTYELYDCWIAAVALEEDSDRIVAIKKVVPLLPEVNRLILRRLMGFLAKVALYSDVNLMTVNNIAIVFAPTLLRPLGDKMDQIIQDSGHGNYLIKLMIEEYNSIFEQQKEPGVKSTNETSKQEATKKDNKAVQEESNEFLKIMKRGSLLLAKGSFIGGKNSFQRLANNQPVIPKSPRDEEPSLDSHTSREGTETEDTEGITEEGTDGIGQEETSTATTSTTTATNEQACTTSEIATETEEEDSNSDSDDSTEDNGATEREVVNRLSVSMEQMMDLILDGQVDRVDRYLAKLPSALAARTKRLLLTQIDLLMQSDDFKD